MQQEHIIKEFGFKWMAVLLKHLFFKEFWKKKKNYDSKLNGFQQEYEI